MGTRMAEREFTPFLPRRFARAPDPPTAQQQAELVAVPGSGSSSSESAADASRTPGPDAVIDSPGSEVVVPATPELREAVQNLEPAGAAADQDDSEPTPSCAVPAEDLLREAVPAAPECDHAYEIRSEAVRLASIACGRALRHAVLLHPQVIAAFVDDALHSTGGRAVQCIRVHDSLLSRIDSRHGSVQGAEGLEPGDLIIDVDGGTIGADLETRAELLVAAAAEP